LVTFLGNERKVMPERRAVGENKVKRLKRKGESREGEEEVVRERVY
jgi:hypothetical protein